MSADEHKAMPSPKRGAAMLVAVSAFAAAAALPVRDACGDEAVTAASIDRSCIEVFAGGTTKRGDAASPLGRPVDRVGKSTVTEREDLAIGRRDTVRIVAEPEVIRNDSVAMLFGANVVWHQMQDGVWDRASGKGRDEVNVALSRIEGALYRYPGGAEANVFDWTAAVGEPSARQPQRSVSWKSAETASFGVPEFFAFTRTVGGTPLLVANIFGAYGQEQADETVQSRVGDAAEAVRKIEPSQPLLWELGNELDRGKEPWSPEKFARRAAAAGAILRHKGGENTIAIVPLLEYQPRGQVPQGQYNETVVKAMPTQQRDYAMHVYYDSPRTLSVKGALDTIVGTVSTIRRLRPTQNIRVWVTEHGRWPLFDLGDRRNNPNWYQLSNVNAGLSVADFIIGLTQIPEVVGAVTGSVNGGPWRWFEVTSRARETTPNAVTYVYTLLSTNTLSEVLRTRIEAPNTSNNRNGYDVRATVFANAARSSYVVWWVNRSMTERRADITLPTASKLGYVGRRQFIAPQTTGELDSPKAGMVCRSDSSRLLGATSPSSTVSVVLPASSVGAYLLESIATTERTE